MGALNQKAIKKMELGLIQLIDKLLDDIEDQNSVDMISDFPARIPIEVIGNLLNIPQDERAPLRGWSLAILSALEPVRIQRFYEPETRRSSILRTISEPLVSDRGKDPRRPHSRRSDSSD
ncbi:MAG: hypothetical protein Ct9H300mP14_06200 [Gammaproteobacteria bacterium]|nr:MAG: hypothetical protein Ct9H300mP14_06200 [Gammaproteobacteria bacterium]